MEIRTRVVPERTLVVISAMRSEPQLDPWVEESFSTIFQYLNQHQLRLNGTTADEPTMLIFHGPVSAEQSSLVEVCVPLVLEADEKFEAHPELTIRAEPEHYEAYISLSREELSQPLIHESYERLYDWLDEHQLEDSALPAREMFVTEPGEAAPDAHVADIVLPYLPAQDLPTSWNTPELPQQVPLPSP